MTLIDYIDHFVVTSIHELNPTYYAVIMLDALLCLMLSTTYHTQNYAGIISVSLNS